MPGEATASQSPLQTAVIRGEGRDPAFLSRGRRPKLDPGLRRGDGTGKRAPFIHPRIPPTLPRMWLHILILTLVTLQRLIELVIAHRNTKKIEARGGFEVGSNRYGFVVALQVLWLAGLWYMVLTYLPPIEPALGLCLCGAGSGARLDRRGAGQQLDDAADGGARREPSRRGLPQLDPLCQLLRGGGRDLHPAHGLRPHLVCAGLRHPQPHAAVLAHAIRG